MYEVLVTVCKVAGAMLIVASIVIFTLLGMTASVACNHGIEGLNGKIRAIRRQSGKRKSTD